MADPQVETQTDAPPPPPVWWGSNQRWALRAGLRAARQGSPAACAALLTIWREAQARGPAQATPPAEAAEPAEAPARPGAPEAVPAPDGRALAAERWPELAEAIAAAADVIEIKSGPAADWWAVDTSALWRGALEGLPRADWPAHLAQIACDPDVLLAMVDELDGPVRWDRAAATVAHLEAAPKKAALLIDALTVTFGAPPAGPLLDRAAAALRAGAASPKLRARVRLTACPGLPTADDSPQPEPDAEIKVIHELTGSAPALRRASAAVALRALRAGGVVATEAEGPEAAQLAALMGGPPLVSTADAQVRLALAGLADAPPPPWKPHGQTHTPSLWSRAVRSAAAQVAASVLQDLKVESEDAANPILHALETSAKDDPRRAAHAAWRAAPPALPDDATPLERWAEASAAFALDPTTARLAAGLRAMAALRRAPGWEAALQTPYLFGELSHSVHHLLAELCWRATSADMTEQYAQQVEAGAWGDPLTWRPNTLPDEVLWIPHEDWLVVPDAAALRAGQRPPTTPWVLPDCDADRVWTPAFTARVTALAEAHRGSPLGAMLTYWLLLRWGYCWAHGTLPPDDRAAATALAVTHPHAILKTGPSADPELIALKRSLLRKNPQLIHVSGVPALAAEVLAQSPQRWGASARRSLHTTLIHHRAIVSTGSIDQLDRLYRIGPAGAAAEPGGAVALLLEALGGPLSLDAALRAFASVEPLAEDTPLVALAAARTLSALPPDEAAQLERALRSRPWPATHPLDFSDQWASFRAPTAAAHGPIAPLPAAG